MVRTGAVPGSCTHNVADASGPSTSTPKVSSAAPGSKASVGTSASPPSPTSATKTVPPLATESSSGIGSA